MGRKHLLDRVDGELASATLRAGDVERRLEEHHQAILARVERGHLWDATPQEQRLGHLLWRASAMIGMGQGFLTTLHEKGARRVDESTVTLMSHLAERANALYLEAVEAQARADHGGDAEALRVEDAPTLPYAPDGAEEQVAPMWEALLTLYASVQSDWRLRVVAERVPHRFRVATRAFELSFEPVRAVIDAEIDRHAMLGGDDRRARAALVGDALQRHLPQLWLHGQLIWAPALLDTLAEGRPYAAHLNDRPGLRELGEELGVDPWCLTDAGRRRELSDDRGAQEQLAQLWARVPDPAAAGRLAAELDAAVGRRAVRLRAGRAYGYPPWPSQYLVRFPVRLGDRRFATGDLLTLYVNEDSGGRVVSEVRRAGRVTRLSELLGSPPG